jgi:hypothetical protein
VTKPLTVYQAVVVMDRIKDLSRRIAVILQKDKRTTWDALELQCLRDERKTIQASLTPLHLVQTE